MRTTVTCTPRAAWTARRRLFISSRPRWSTNARVRSWSRRRSSPSNSTTSTITSLSSAGKFTPAACLRCLISVHQSSR
ncbi:hypothetical protein FQN60_016471 [Etheostoma spectabile]|uniref:Uncharacterized protein n=1 Tax=Etheostoma spectabile TaxID=54343 RepID=A0A5J5D292_9PERO|nr:hypothetical protein FQN60_016471 [Etheostoma spectabile]